MVDVAVPDVRLQAAGIHALVGERVAGRMSQHMRMNLERQPRPRAGPRDQERKADRTERPTAFRQEDEIRVRRRLPLEAT